MEYNYTYFSVIYRENNFDMKKFKEKLNLDNFKVKDYGKVNSFGKPKVLGTKECKLVFVSSNPKQMRWDLTGVDKENWDVLWVADERQIFPEGTSLPTNIILTKVE